MVTPNKVKLYPAHKKNPDHSLTIIKARRAPGSLSIEQHTFLAVSNHPHQRGIEREVQVERAMAAEKEVKLLGFWVSPFSIRCRIALEENEVEYEYKEEDLAEKSELLLKSNPVHKKTPVLLHHGKPICESLIIVQYIDEVFPGKASILPSDPYARALALFWADFVDKKIFECAIRLWKLKKGKELEETKKELVENLTTLEVELGEKKYFGGEDFGLVDFALVPFISWFYSFEVFADLSVEQECPKLAVWVKRCQERESVAKSLPQPKRVYELFSSRRKKLGVE